MDEPKTLFITESNFRAPSIFDLSNTARLGFFAPLLEERLGAGNDGDNKKRETRPKRPFSRR